MVEKNPSAGSRPRRLLPVLFFFSGLSGLVYEVLWREELGLLFGHTWEATAVVLAVYMGGLALGAALAGLVADRLRRPLIAYAVLEAAIGLSALLVPVLIDAGYPLYKMAFRELGPGAGLTALRLGIASCALLLPTLFMGATIPILSRFAAGGTFQREFPLLYGANTIGAAAGALVSAFLLLPTLGRTGSMYTAVTGSLVVAAAAFLLARRTPSMPTTKPESETQTAPVPKAPATSKLILPLAICGGLLTLGLEVYLTHHLALTLGCSVYAFGIMLSAFILGLGLASIICSIWTGRGGQPWDLVIFSLAGGGLLVILITPCLGILPYILVSVTKLWSQSFFLLNLARMVLTFMLIGLPALLLGLNLPALIIAAGRTGRESRLTGRIYALNTAGAVAGPLLVGFWLLPAGIGSRMGLLGGGLILISMGLITTLIRRQRRLPCTLAAATGLALVILLPHWNQALESAGFHLYAGIRHKEKKVEEILTNRELLFYKEGIHGTVAVARILDSGDNPGLNYSMNGKVEGSTFPGDMFTQVRVCEIPLAICPREPKEVYLLGLGTGISLAALLRFPTVERVDLLEISPEVIEVARGPFQPYNNNCMTDPRVELIQEDGRTFLTFSERKYDVVISEPSNPWMAGIADLFTVENFRAMRARTRNGGVVCQWVQGYLLAQERFKTILRTWLQVFPKSMATVSHINASDIFLIGLVDDQPNTNWIIDARRVRQRLQTRNTYAFAEQSDSPPRNTGDLFHPFLAGPKKLTAWAGKGTIHTDDFPILAYTAPRDLYNEEATMLRWPDLPEMMESAAVMVANLSEGELAEMMAQHVHMTCNAFLLDSNLNENKLPLAVIRRAEKLLDEFTTSPLCKNYYFPWLVRGRLWTRGVDPKDNTSSRKWAPGCNRTRAIACFTKAAALTKVVIDPWLYLARCHQRGDRGDLHGPGSSPGKALQAAHRALQLAPSSEEAAVLYAEILFAVKQDSRARSVLEEFIKVNPEACAKAKSLHKRLFKK